VLQWKQVHSFQSGEHAATAQGQKGGQTQLALGDVLQEAVSLVRADAIGGQ
jgi:hypothetical protein